MTTTTDHAAVAEAYLGAFNETDAGRRRERLEALLAPGARYTDPQVDVEGPARFAAFIAATQDQFPGVAFVLHGPVDGHHHQCRFRWQAGPFVGFDVLELDEAGRVRRVLGFIDEAPAA